MYVIYLQFTIQLWATFIRSFDTSNLGPLKVKYLSCPYYFQINTRFSVYQISGRLRCVGVHWVVWGLTGRLRTSGVAETKWKMWGEGEGPSRLVFGDKWLAYKHTRNLSWVKGPPKPNVPGATTWLKTALAVCKVAMLHDLFLLPIRVSQNRKKGFTSQANRNRWISMFLFFSSGNNSGILNVRWSKFAI